MLGQKHVGCPRFARYYSPRIFAPKRGVRRQMAKITLETYNSELHRNHMPEVLSPSLPRMVLVVLEKGFRLEFLSIDQLEAAICYFSAPLGTTRLPFINGDHWEFQPWQSRLPKGINNKHNRSRILAALISARALGSGQIPSNLSPN